MLNSGLCEIARQTLGQMSGERLEELAKRLPYAPGQEGKVQELEQVARDFASVIYSILVREMQKTVPQDEDAGPFAQGVRDFMQMHLPRTMADHQGDPLVQYLRQQLNVQRGASINEKV